MEISKRIYSIRNKVILIPFIVALVGAILMLSCVVLPYGTATDNFEKYLSEYGQDIPAELEMDAEDIKNLSMIDFVKIQMAGGKNNGLDDLVGYFYAIIVGLIGALSLLAIISILTKSPVVAVLFDVFSVGMFLLHSWDYTSRKVIPGEYYEWGIGYYVFFVAAVILFVGAAWLFTAKLVVKSKAVKLAEDTNEAVEDIVINNRYEEVPENIKKKFKGKKK